MEYVNKVKLLGTLTRDIEYSHEFNGVPFYSLEVELVRSSNVRKEVLVRCYFTGEQLAKYELKKGLIVELSGKFINSKIKGVTDISILVEDYRVVDESEETPEETCEIEMSGQVTKIFTTPDNFTGLVNFVIAQHDEETGKKIFSTRVIIWGRLAEHVFNNLQVGDDVLVKGVANNSKTNAREYDENGNLIKNENPEIILVSEILGTYFTKLSDKQ